METLWAGNCRRFVGQCWLSLALFICLYGMACNDSATNRAVPSPASPLPLRRGKTLAVIGVKQATSHLTSAEMQNLQSPRVGFGLTALVVEAVVSTGHFRPFEDKEVHKRELLEHLAHQYWIEPREPYSAQRLHEVAIQLGVELLAYGSLTNASLSKRSIDIGPMKLIVEKLQIEVSVCLYDVSTRTTLCEEGHGEARQEGMGIIYEFDGDHLTFKKNAVGIATMEAIQQAVHRLLSHIIFVP